MRIAGGVSSRRRTATVDAIVGTRDEPATPTGGRGFSLPAVDLDTYLVMRLVPPEIRAGFRAWVAALDHGQQKHWVSDWDRLRTAYERAELK